MKRLLSFLSLLIVAVSSFAQQFTVGGLTYSVLSTTDKTAQVYNGKNATGDVIVPETITYNGVEYNVTAIAENAFNGNKNITSVSLPSITSIGSNAFYYCSALSAVSLPAAVSIGVQAFIGCSSIVSVSLPAATTISGSAFYGCNSLASIDLPAATSIGDGAFYGCNSLASIDLPAATSIDSRAFCNCSVLTSVGLPNATSIGNETFRDCVALTSANLPAVTSIGINAFTRCTSLNSVSLPTATSIGSYAFSGCSALASVELPAATSIGSYAFYVCSSLTSIELSAVTSIGDQAFQNSSNISSLRIGSVEQWCNVNFGSSGANPLQISKQTAELYIGDSDTPATDIVAPNTVTKIPDYAFRRTTVTSITAPAATSIGAGTFADCPLLASVYIPAATSISGSAFSGCSALASVELSAATSVGNNAFDGCSSLESLEFPNVTSIGNYAFRDCSNLVYASLPVATTIGTYAFYKCSSLESLDLSAATSIGSYAFQNCTKINSLRIGSVEQWCNVNFGGSYTNPLQVASQTIELYIGDSETPATSIEVPNTVTEIPNYAFRKTTITSVTAPAASSIGIYAFYGCSSLASVSIPVATSIGNYAFQSCSVRFVELPTATSIGTNAFYSCSSLASVSLPVATSIGNSAFSGCSSLASVSLPVATSIGNSAFSGCSSLASVSLPSATSIGSSAFQSCSSLASVALPSVTSIGTDAFKYSSKIMSLRIGSAEQWCNVSFGNENSNPLYITSQYVDLYIDDSESPVPSIEIPSTVYDIPDYAFRRTRIASISATSATSIGSSAFSGCSSLASVSLPVATSIGNSAFSGCSSLASVSLPVATSIGNSAFSGCSSLASVSLHVATSIGSSAFSGCSSLASVSLPVATSIGNSAFASCKELCQIHLPSVPPLVSNTNSFPTWTMLAVPDEAYETYLAADVYNTIPLQITKEGYSVKTIDMEADATTSRLLAKIGEENVRHVIDLKIIGTINSYDMMIIRNQMTSLRKLDISEASIVDCNYFYSQNYHSISDVITADWLKNLMYVKLPATVKTIANSAFYGCTKLISVEIPEGVTSIGSYSFYNCSNLKNLIIPRSVVTFGSYAFNNCTGLKEIDIPEGVTSIPYRAFYGCSDLEWVRIPESVKEIGINAFYCSHPITLYISSLENWLNVSTAMAIWDESNTQIGYTTDQERSFSEIGKLYIGDSTIPVEEIVIPEGINRLKDCAFAGFKCIKSVVFPKEVSQIGEKAFQNCIGLTKIKCPESLTEISNFVFGGCINIEQIEFSDRISAIGSNAFLGCSKLTKLELPPYLKSIGSYAFQDCSNLSEVLIPASITEIKDYAFRGCSNLNRVIATTVEPVKINQNTFSTYQTATLYSPKTSYYKYYWNTQYNQFLARKEYDKEFAKSFGYKYFYLNGVNGDNNEDFEISDETGPLHGVGEDNPDADFNEGAGMIVSGEQIQNLGDIHIHHNGNNGASVIAKNKGKVHIDNLYVDIKTQKNRWYFFCFPFDIKPGEATYDGSHVWYLYDGEARALNGNGGWKKVANDGVMKSGNGYIFQGAVNGTLTIHVSDITIDTNDASTNMITYQSDNKNDASWNLIGNANFAYYDIDNLGYDAPITVYNNETGNYEAVRAEDEDYEFYPFQAFFVQKPEGTDAMTFEAKKKETKNKSDENQARRAAARAGAPKKVDPSRKLINLELSAVDLTEDAETAAAADRTRIVVNAAKSLAYEPECDAAKFIADGMPQIYSLDAENTMYAINERPAADGIVPLAVKITEEGFYTISASRLDCAAQLRDLETGDVIDLAEGDYTFAAKAKTYTQRFQLLLADAVEGIEAIEVADAISVEAGAISVGDARADVKIYTAGGVLVAAQKGLGSVKVPAGVYVINVNGQSTKVNVKE